MVANIKKVGLRLLRPIALSFTILIVILMYNLYGFIKKQLAICFTYLVLILQQLVDVLAGKSTQLLVLESIWT